MKNQAMSWRFGLGLVSMLAAGAPSLGGCGGDDENDATTQPAGSAGTSSGGASAGGGAGAGGAGMSGGGATTGGAGGAVSLQPFTPPADPGKGKFLVTASGEDFALGGFEFENGKSKAGDPAFVDGWAVKFDHIIVTYAEVTLNEGADSDPADKTKIGKEVGKATGPWAVDLAKGGPLTGKAGPGEQAVALAAIDGTFDSATRYALSFATSPATVGAKNVNLDAEALSLYSTAIERGWSVVYVGTATFRGPAPAAGTAFELMPTEVRFSFGVKAAATMTNCENPDLGQSALGEDFARGVQILPNASSVIQLTWHTDHLFWDALEQEEVPLHFDQFAVRSSTFGTKGAAAGAVSLDDVAGVDFTFFRSKSGAELPGRSFVSDYTAPAGTLGFSSGSVNIPKNDYAEFVRNAVVESSHLNADGECAARLKP